jgi:hypothetical protein
MNDMNYFTTLFINVNGLFDFDLTFPTQAFLFLVLSIVVTFFFLTPISNQLEKRSEFLNYTIKKSTILLTLGYENLYNCVGLLTEEIEEMTRQTKLVRNYTNEKFETEVLVVQKENSKILSKLKGDLSIKSAFLLSSLKEDVSKLTERFFEKRFN